MNYKVLYRKYRPIDFDSVVDQNYIIKTLKNSVSTGNISHAYIFSGPRGTGKTTTAKIFAKAVNCLNNKNGSPCNECEFCENYVENPDIIEIDAASNNGVDQVRELIDNIKLSPTNGKYKVYIIDEVHMLSTNAFNALLLTLEEPPSHVVFIFATTNIESVPITILSRCQRYDFKKISLDGIIDRMKHVCNIENILIDDNALKEIALLAEGGLRDALSLLDQLSKENENITVEKVEEQLRSISTNSLRNMVEYIENNDVKSLIGFINILKNKGVDYKTFIKKTIVVCSNAAKNIKVSAKRNRLMYDDYQNMIIELVDTLNNININVDPYLIVELVFLKYMNIDEENDKTNYSVNNNLEIVNETLEKENIDNYEESPANIKKHKEIINNELYEQFVDIRINNCFVDAKKEWLLKIHKDFQNFVKNENLSKDVSSMIIDSIPVASSLKYTIFSVSNEHIANNINENIIEIEKNFNKIFGTELRFVFISNERWDKEKKKYIENLKCGKVYNYQKEKEINKSETMHHDIVTDLFDINKIEIV